MATLSEIFSDPKALEAIFRGLIGAGTAAAGIQQATSPQTTTVTRGTPGAPSEMETEALGLGFGTMASQLPGMGVTRTPTGVSFQPTPEEQELVLGLNRTMRTLNARVGGGPASLRGPADAMTNAALTGRPTMDRSRLIGLIKAKMGGNVSGPGQGSTIDMVRGSDGSFSVPTANGANFNIPSSAVDLPSSTPGAPGQPRASTSGAGGLTSALGIGTGILGAGAGVLQIAKALGLFGETGSTGTAQLLASKTGIAVELAQQLVSNMPLLKAVDLGLKLRGIDTSQIGKVVPPGGFEELANSFGEESALGFGEFPSSGISEFNLDPGILDLGAEAGITGGESILGLESIPFESAFSGLDFAGPGASSAALEAGDLASQIGNFFGVGSTGPLAFASALGIPLSIVLGSLPFIGQRAKEEKAKEKGFASSYFEQVTRDPQAWAQHLEEGYRNEGYGDWGRLVADAALAGKINNSKDVVKAVLGSSAADDLINELESLGDQTIPLLSQWATRFIAAPGEQWHGPILIESNPQDIKVLFELLKNPAAIIANAREGKRLRDKYGGTQLGQIRQAIASVGGDESLVRIDDENGHILVYDDTGDEARWKRFDDERNDE